jgi:hypothetical protein
MAKAAMRDIIILLPGITGSVLVDEQGHEIWNASGAAAWSYIRSLGKQPQRPHLVRAEPHPAPCARCSRQFRTAGHNALRGSGPGQLHAFDNAVARVGCPDRNKLRTSFLHIAETDCVAASSPDPVRA